MDIDVILGILLVLALLRYVSLRKQVKAQLSLQTLLNDRSRIIEALCADGLDTVEYSRLRMVLSETDSMIFRIRD